MAVLKDVFGFSTEKRVSSYLTDLVIDIEEFYKTVGF
jgi:hypothetical protein